MESFGSILTTGDLNRDGYADLIIGSPYARGGKGTYMTSVYVM